MTIFDLFENFKLENLLQRKNIAKYKVIRYFPSKKEATIWTNQFYQIEENHILYDVFDTSTRRDWFKENTVKLGPDFNFCTGTLHREDGPAVEHYAGYNAWYKDGKIHRIGAPAYQKGFDYKDGEEWYFEGKLHREDGPAAIVKNDGPAWDGSHWYINGNKHRLDGPAVELDSGVKEWYYQGEKINCSSQEEFEKILKLKVFW